MLAPPSERRSATIHSLGLPIATVTAERERVPTDAELADVWAAVETLTYRWGPFFRIAILTLQRREEVAAMRWSEIAPNLSVWNMPGARMKNGKPHDAYLSQPAQAVLRALSEARSKDGRGGKVEIRDVVFSATGETSISFLKAEGPYRCCDRSSACQRRGRHWDATRSARPLAPARPAADGRAAWLRYD
jgi:integrase